MYLDAQARTDVHNFIRDNPNFRVDRVEHRLPPNSQQVGTYPVDTVVTHIPTGIKVVVPFEASRSEIKRHEFAMALFAVTCLTLGLDSATLQPGRRV